MLLKALLVLTVLFGLYVSSYIVLSRAWRSELQAAFGPNSIDPGTCYVPPSRLGTEEGYRLHLMLAAFYEPLWRLDRRLGGPSPLCITFCISSEK